MEEENTYVDELNQNLSSGLHDQMIDFVNTTYRKKSRIKNFTFWEDQWHKF